MKVFARGKKFQLSIDFEKPKGQAILLAEQHFVARYCIRIFVYAGHIVKIRIINLKIAPIHR
jgi:hypothetical protein